MTAAATTVVPSRIPGRVSGRGPSGPVSASCRPRRASRRRRG
jgi:hypothetical protein